MFLERWLEFVKILRIIVLSLVLNLNFKNNLFKKCWNVWYIVYWKYFNIKFIKKKVFFFFLGDKFVLFCLIRYIDK